MPQLSATSIAVIVLALLAGMLTGWVLRAKRGKAEKVAINEGWHAQMEATRREHGRLAEQNKSLMEQVSQLQGSSRDAGNRARELSTALKEALARRDELQREIKAIRGNLENVVSQKHRLNDNLSEVKAIEAAHAAALAERDRRIAKLQTELRNWQDRLPPLVGRFRERNEEANRLAEELAAAEERIRGLEGVLGTEQTRVEPLAVNSELERYIASNEQLHREAEPDDEPGADDDGGVPLTVLINLSGGIENPFYFVYVIHVILASLLLKGPEIFKIALIAGALILEQAFPDIDPLGDIR